MIVLTAPETWPFGSALVVMVGLTLVEGAGLLMSQSPSAWLDGLLPDLPEGTEGVLGWLHVGTVPMLVVLILFLAGFALSGYGIQAILAASVGTLLPAWLVAMPAVLAGVLTVRGVGGLIARLMPGDESFAVSAQSLVGRTGTIVRGIAKADLAAEAKVRDAHGRVHYVLVEPDLADQTFNEGADVLLVKKVGAKFRCVRNPHDTL